MSRLRHTKGPGAWVLLTLLLVLTARLEAHVQVGQAAGFLTGLRHPISGPDHVLAMILVGVWGAQLGLPALWLLPVTFPMVMAFGGFLALVGVPLPGSEVGIAIGVIHRWRAGKVTLRVAGAAAASIGLGFLWRAFA